MTAQNHYKEKLSPNTILKILRKKQTLQSTISIFSSFSLI